MREKVTTRRKQRRTTLFAKIAGNLIFPLVTLAALFAAIQLTGEMRAIHEAQRMTSRLALNSVYQTLSFELKGSADKKDTDLKKAIHGLTDFHEEMAISLYSLLDRSQLIEAGTPWTEADQEFAETAVKEKQGGKPYIVRVNRKENRLAAYIPLQRGPADPIYISRIQIPLANIGTALVNSRVTLLLMAILIVITGMVIGIRLSQSIVKPIMTLNQATREIVRGKLGRHVHIKTGDEIEGLASTFNEMSDALKGMKQEAVDSNPLTGLPGNRGIFEELKERIHQRKKFVLFHTDLDRFKVFNDHYGLAKGDEAIVKTADVLRECVKKAGNKDDFIGHQGGDDYVVITTPAKAKELAELIIKEFDEKVVQALYKPEDIRRGHILQLDRRHLAETGEERMVEFPFLAVSLAGVTNAKKDFADYFDCMSQAVAVKKIAKAPIESSYYIQE